MRNQSRFFGIFFVNHRRIIIRSPSTYTFKSSALTPKGFSALISCKMNKFISSQISQYQASSKNCVELFLVFSLKEPSKVYTTYRLSRVESLDVFQESTKVYPHAVLKSLGFYFLPSISALSLRLCGAVK